MEQHPVPQHIASFEFKLFGNLTVRQFVTLAIPTSIAALFFFSNLPAPLRFSLAIIFGGVGIFAALVPVQGRPLDKWLALFIRAIVAPTQRVWIKDSKLPEFLNVVISRPPTSREPIEPITTRDKERLKNYLRSLPRGQSSPFDVKEQIAIQRLGLTYEGAGLGKLPPAIVGGRASLPQVSTMPQASATQTAGMPVAEEEYQGAMAESLPAVGAKAQQGHKVQISNHAKPFALPGLGKKLTQEHKVKPKVQLASDMNFSIENVIPITTAGRRVRLVHGVGKTRARKLHFGPPQGFDLSNLPIRGEARFEVSDQLKKRLDPSIFVDESGSVSEVPTPLVPRPPESFVKAPANMTQDMQREHMGMPVHQAQMKSEEISVAPQQPQELGDQRMQVSSEQTVGARPADVLSRAQIVPLTNKPNVLSGLVTDGSGMPIAGAIVTVRDENGVPIRALKTNKLGQFLSATPLPMGTYTLEVEGAAAAFEPLTLNIKGEVLAPLSIKPRQ